EAIDKGLEGIVACSTAISSIVDVNLTFSGYIIDDLAEHSTFEETAFLLWNKRLPTGTELEKFRKDISQRMKLEKEYLSFLKALPHKNVHPMEWLRTAVSALALWDKKANDISLEANHEKALDLIAKMGPIVAAFERI